MKEGNHKTKRKGGRGQTVKYVGVVLFAFSLRTANALSCSECVHIATWYVRS